MRANRSAFLPSYELILNVSILLKFIHYALLFWIQCFILFITFRLVPGNSTPCVSWFSHSSMYAYLACLVFNCKYYYELVSVKERSIVPSTRMHLGLSEISGNTGIVMYLRCYSQCFCKCMHFSSLLFTTNPKHYLCNPYCLNSLLQHSTLQFLLPNLKFYFSNKTGSKFRSTALCNTYILMHTNIYDSRQEHGFHNQDIELIFVASMFPVFRCILRVAKCSEMKLILMFASARLGCNRDFQNALSLREN